MLKWSGGCGRCGPSQGLVINWTEYAVGPLLAVRLRERAMQIGQHTVYLATDAEVERGKEEETRRALGDDAIGED